MPTDRPGDAGFDYATAGHVPVLRVEAIQALAPRSGGRYLDATFGGGGHTRALLDATAPEGAVLALDADPAAVERGKALAQRADWRGRLHLVHANFADLAEVAREARFIPLDGVLMDLGLSSFQVDVADRGFAFRFEGPLDMRFDPTRGQPAAALVNELPEGELADLLFTYGEEPHSRRIARAIVAQRTKAPIESTKQLAEIVSNAVGGRRGADTHPATRTFQALRIATNHELDVLQESLEAAVDVLAPGGRLAVISFHSLEDRIVKTFMQRESATCICPPAQPVCTCNHQPRLIKITARPIRPSPAEIAANPRGRSALLRVAERLDDSSPANG